jgi:hypothetical protein
MQRSIVLGMMSVLGCISAGQEALAAPGDKVWLSTTEYEIEAPPNHDPTPPSFPGLVFEYAGRAKYTTAMAPTGDPDDEPVAYGSLGAFFAEATIEDAGGNLFRIVDVDEADIEASLDAYDSELAEEDRGYLDFPYTVGDTDDVGAVQHPMSWTGVDFDGDGEKDEWTHSDGWTLGDYTRTSGVAKRTVFWSFGVRSVTDGDIVRKCSGFLVAPKVVVTAAHCAMPDKGVYYGGPGSADYRGRVCTLGNGDPAEGTGTPRQLGTSTRCSFVHSRIDFGYTGNFKLDYMVLLLDEPVLMSSEWALAISGATDSRISSDAVNLIGWPGTHSAGLFFNVNSLNPNGASNPWPDPYPVGNVRTPGDIRATVMTSGQTAKGDVTGLSGTYIKTKLRIQKAMSGGPILQGRADGGTVVVGVLAGYQSWPATWTGGVKSVVFKTHVVPFLP